MSGGPILVLGADAKPLPEEARLALRALEIPGTLYSDRIDNPALLRGLQTLANRGLILRHRTKIDGQSVEVFSPKAEAQPGFTATGYVAKRTDGALQNPEAVRAEIRRRDAVPAPRPSAPAPDPERWLEWRKGQAAKHQQDAADAEAFRELAEFLDLRMYDESVVGGFCGDHFVNAETLPKVAAVLRARQGDERRAA